MKTMSPTELVWCADMLQNEASQQVLEQKVKALLEGPLRQKSDYAKEKAVKSFSEGIRYLESVLLYQRDIHRDQLNLLEISKNMKAYQDKQLEVEKIVKMEIHRQMRHYLTFLA